jgi:outer membrane lipoprotein-sorting protein
MNEEAFMKRFIITCILGVFLTTIVFSAGMAQSSEEVLAKMIEAQGGKAALAKVKDMTFTGTIEIVTMGISGSMTMYRKEPDKARMDMEFMGMVVTQSFDGENAWGVDPNTGSIVDMPEDQAKELKRMAIGNDSLLHPEKYGITFTFKGKETLEGKEYFLLEQSYDDGHKETLYIDAQTYLVHKSKTMAADMSGIQVDTETFVSDYKKVDGLVVGHSMRIVQEGQEAMVMTFSEVALNTGLEDSLFKKEE